MPDYHIRQCHQAQDYATQALKRAHDLFPDATLHNGSGDAFRHCDWSGLMTFKWGKGTAKGFADRHEDYKDNPPAEKFMDKHNNSWGRKYENDRDATRASMESKCVRGTRRGGVLKVLVR